MAKKKMGPREIADEKRQAALKEVRALVKRHGFRAVSGALKRLNDHDKALRRVAELKAEAARLERRLT